MNRIKKKEFLLGLMLTLAVLLTGVGVTEARPWCPVDPAQRFLVLPIATGGGAVLDRETNLVWQQRPFSATEGVKTWQSAANSCFDVTNGNAGGWRLPTVAELTSLVFPAGGPPAGHPFQDINLVTDYWTSTDAPGAAGSKLRVQTSPPNVNATTVSEQLGVWCVRGGKGVSHSSTN